MLIKLSDLNFQLGNKFPAVFFLISQDHFQLTHQANIIKSTWKQYFPNEVDTKIIHINSTPDWLTIEQEANSYPLFSNTIFIDARFEKKTLDATAKSVLERYLDAVNPRSLLLIRAPNLPLKQLQSVVNKESVHVIFSSPPKKAVILKWINDKLNQKTRQYDPQIPVLIYQYNEGNLLGVAQVLDKLELIAEDNEPLTLHEVKEQLINQCYYPLFELADSCLTGDSSKALQLLRQAYGSKVEPTLILWLLTQEIRLLMQLLPSSTPMLSFKEMASQLKIWSNRIGIYQSAIKKYNRDFLISLLQYCNKVDTQIKTNQSKFVWQSFELIALCLCTGKKVGYIA